MTKTILLTGGGTAGHVTPNLALLPQLQCKHPIRHRGVHKLDGRAICPVLDGFHAGGFVIAIVPADQNALAGLVI